MQNITPKHNCRKCRGKGELEYSWPHEEPYKIICDCIINKMKRKQKKNGKDNSQNE
jgi:hypothetical protein